MTFFESLWSDIYQSLIYEDRYLFLLSGLATTMILTLSSFILGTLLGALFCFFLRSRLAWLRRLTKTITQLFIQLPSLVLLMLFVYVVFVQIPLSVLVLAIFGFTLKTASYMSDIFYTAVDSVDKGESEVSRALGMSAAQSFWFVTFPQAVRVAMPLYRNQFIQTLQETAVVGYIAIEDLTRASDVISSRTLKPMVSLIIISVIYILVGSIVSKLLSLISREKHLSAGI